MQRAAATDLKPEDMVSSLFIFSDMEFDEATDMSPYRSFASLFNQPRDPTNFEKAKVDTSEMMQNLRNLGIVILFHAYFSHLLLCLRLFFMNMPCCTFTVQHHASLTAFQAAGRPNSTAILPTCV